MGDFGNAQDRSVFLVPFEQLNLHDFCFLRVFGRLETSPQSGTTGPKIFPLSSENSGESQNVSAAGDT